MSRVRSPTTEGAPVNPVAGSAVQDPQVQRPTKENAGNRVYEGWNAGEGGGMSKLPPLPSCVNSWTHAMAKVLIEYAEEYGAACRAAAFEEVANRRGSQMTLLERWDDGNFSTDDYELDAAIRRALAIAQKFEQFVADVGHNKTTRTIADGTNELLAKEKSDDAA